MADEKWLCPLCGQESSGDVCEWCGAEKPASNAEIVSEEAKADEQIEQATALVEDESLGDEFGLDDLSEFEIDATEIEEEAEISEDLEGFAKGFPDWDLHPPKK